MYLILFLCVTLAIALVLIKATETKTKRKYEEFLQAVREGSEAAVPETAGFEIVMGQGQKMQYQRLKVMTEYRLVMPLCQILLSVTGK